VRVTESTVSKMTISDVDGLDTINVIFEDFNPEQGRVTIECFGSAWAHYWPAMGDHTIRQFFATSHVDYLIGKLIDGRTHEPDYDKMSKDTGAPIYDEESCNAYSDKLVDVYGQDWMIDYPTRKTADYEYLGRIVTTIQNALTQNQGTDIMRAVT